MKIPNIQMIKQDLMVFWIIATTSICIGLLYNQFREKPLPWKYQSKAQRLSEAVAHISTNPEANNASPLPTSMSLTELQKFLAQKRGLVLDARPEIFHRLGHIPGAFPLPRDDFENAYNKLKEMLESNKNQPLVVYCSGASCEDSRLVQEALIKLSYTQVSLFHGGWSEWTQAHLPEEKNQ